MFFVGKLWAVTRNIALILLMILAIYGFGRAIQLSLDSHDQGSRGPYLQMLSEQAVTLKWQTSDADMPTVRYGQNQVDLNRHAVVSGSRTKHEVRLSGLSPATRYYYHISGKESWHGSFHTAPLAGSDAPIRLWVTGDQGETGSIQNEVRDAALQWAIDNQRYERPLFDFWITTGDNAYRSGTIVQFQNKFFEPYADILANIPVWPAYGNHDARRWAFFELFSLPRLAESGGTPSHTEHFYSFDYGQLRVVMLDSEASSLAADGAMARWLKNDLASTTQPWRIAVMHHPAYTKGSHDSDNPRDSSGRIFRVRENILPLLEGLGVDLILTGHSHSYERSHSIACHYQPSSSWKPSYLRDDQSPYRKGVGVVHMVIGSSAKLDVAALDHPAMPISHNLTGSVIIDIEGDTLISRFIGQDGTIIDEFEITRGNDGLHQTINCDDL